MVNQVDPDAFFDEIYEERKRIMKQQEDLWEADVKYINDHIRNNVTKGEILVVNVKDSNGVPIKQNINANVVSRGKVKSNILIKNKNLVPYFTSLIDTERDSILIKAPFLARESLPLGKILSIHPNNEFSCRFTEHVLRGGSNVFFHRPSDNNANTLTSTISSENGLLKSQIKISGCENQNIYADSGNLCDGFLIGIKEFNQKMLKLCILGMKDSQSHNLKALCLPIIQIPSLEKFISLFKLYIELSDLQYDAKNIKGSGNFSTFYYGKYKGHTVGIKKLKQRGEGFQALFSIYKEFIIQSYLLHPNIAPIIGVSLDNDYPIIVLPWINGGSMDKYIAGQAMLVDHQLYSITKQFASALEYLRSRCIVHRDLGARNILVKINQEDTQSLKIMLCDFGMASCYPSLKLENGAFRYLAPETFWNGSYTYSSEVYGFALTMIEILAQGEQPFINMTLKDLKDFYLKDKASVFNKHRSTQMDISQYSNIPSNYAGMLKECLHLCGLCRWKIRDDIIPFLELKYQPELKGEKIVLKGIGKIENEYDQGIKDLNVEGNYM